MSNKITTQPEISPPGGQILLYSEGQTNINVRIEGETVWLTQRSLAELYGVSVKTVNEHLVNIYEEEELPPGATIPSPATNWSFSDARKCLYSVITFLLQGRTHAHPAF